MILKNKTFKSLKCLQLFLHRS